MTAQHTDPMRLSCSPVPNSCTCPIPQLTALLARALWRSEGWLLLVLHCAASPLRCCWWEAIVCQATNLGMENATSALLRGTGCVERAWVTARNLACAVCMYRHFTGTQQCFLTFHLLLSQAAAVFSEALLGQNCHGAHCRLPTHTQSGYATGRDKRGSTITNAIQDAQTLFHEDKVCVIKHFSSQSLEKHPQCQSAA